MKHLISKDGTPIAYDSRGEGSPLVLVHGTGIDHTYWDPIMPELERQFEVTILDRRGRGESGDTPPYSIQRELFGARGYKLDPDRFRSMTVPTLLVLGMESIPLYKAATEAVHASLPNSRISVLSGHRHEAVITAPDLVLSEIIKFLA